MTLHQERFEAWLFAQPRDREINPMDGARCFLSSFARETTNLKNPGCNWSLWWDDTTPRIERFLPRQATDIPWHWSGTAPSPSYQVAYTTQVSRPAGELIPEWARKLINYRMLPECSFRCVSVTDPPPIFTEPSLSLVMTCGQMQDRYVQLFGDPRTRQTEPVTVPEQKPEPVNA